jgi:3-hydroxybenzoate 6-monooxygenase
VLEKGADFAEIGAGLQLAPNATRVLAKLGVLEALDAHAVFPARLQWMDALAEQPITSIDLGAAFRKRYGAPYLVMHRGDLLAALVEACRKNPLVTLEADRDVIAVDDLGEGARARLANGRVYETELLVAADGLWSQTRKMIHDDTPIGDGYVAYRGTLPIGQMSKHAGLDNVAMWIGPGMHFVQYPIRGGEIYNQVAVFKSPRYRPGSDDWGTPDELDAHFAQCCGYVQNCIKVMWRDKRWPMYDRKPISAWVKNRIVLLGDAAHPMYQYIAQGACQAIEDAFSLGRHVGAGQGDLRGALEAYQNARNQRTARVQLTARAMGAFFHLDGMAATVRNAMMKPRAPDDYAMLDWLYGHEA